ncbi:hypothetical protein GGR21_003606 [Dysgonomonas hofstadii]|uniref:Uncharacterized protein n=1 Tax=Dysgonomonas hofstadii TaxID=637886 RepID=A0A840CY58_9BACT|nr:hypothetical protein [Dysgonomonas hofstadii]
MGYFQICVSDSKSISYAASDFFSKYIKLRANFFSEAA